MIGYPKYIATRQDFINMLSIDEYRTQALAHLADVYAAKDDTATRVIGTGADGEDLVEAIPNPMPIWKQKGFASRQDVADVIARYGGEV